MKVFLFLAEGFEEIEAIAVIDTLRRAGLNIETISVSKKLIVKGAHGIGIEADGLFEEADLFSGDMLILPGGMPGAKNLNEHAGLKAVIFSYFEKGKRLSAICAAPIVFGGMGLLKGKEATCYPGFESALEDAVLQTEKGVVVSGNIITGKGPGFAIDFALTIIETLLGKEKADEVASGMLLK